QHMQMVPSPPQQIVPSTGIPQQNQPLPSKNAWNDVPFASTAQQTARKPLVVTPPQQPTPRMQPQMAPPVPSQAAHIQTPRMQPQMPPPIPAQQQGIPQQFGQPQPASLMQQQAGYPHVPSPSQQQTP